MRKLLLIFLFAPVLGFGQTAIYRSVQNAKTSAIASPASMSISGTTMTVSALPDTIGVGDAVEYDSTGVSGTHNNICFIAGRTSSTSYTVQRFQGGTPASCTAATNATIFRAYTNISSWESGSENTGITAGIRNFDTGNRNISTANEQWNVAVYAGGDSTNLTIDGWTTSATCYIRIYAPYLTTEVGITQRHQGIFSRKYAFLKNSSGAQVVQLNSVSNNPAHIRFDGLQIWQNGSGASAANGINNSSGNVATGYDLRVSNCILRGTKQSATSGVHCGVYYFNGSSVTGKIRVWNNIVYDWTSTGVVAPAGVALRGAGMTMYVYNNTFFNNKIGVYRTDGTLTPINNIGDIHSTATNWSNFAGTMTSGDYNIGNLTSDAPGAHSKNLTLVAFVDSTNYNFLIKSTDTAAKNSGTDLSGDANLSFSTDILGNTRPQGASWDIGAHEVTASGKFGQTIIIGSAEKTIKVFAGLLFSALLTGLILTRKFK